VRLLRFPPGCSSAIGRGAVGSTFSTSSMRDLQSRNDHARSPPFARGKRHHPAMSYRSGRGSAGTLERVVPPDDGSDEPEEVGPGALEGGPRASEVDRLGPRKVREPLRCGLASCDAPPLQLRSPRGARPEEDAALEVTSAVAGRRGRRSRTGAHRRESDDQGEHDPKGGGDGHLSKPSPPDLGCHPTRESRASCDGTREVSWLLHDDSTPQMREATKANRSFGRAKLAGEGRDLRVLLRHAAAPRAPR